MPGSSSRPPVGQRALALHSRDLGVEQLVVHGDLAHLGFQPSDLIVAVIALAFWTHQMRSKRQAAWETAARCAALTEEADDPHERKYYVRLRDAWITLAKRCEFFSISDVTNSEKF